MNIVLVPYTFARHLTVSLATGSAAVAAWWMMLFFTVQVRPIIGFGFQHWFEGAFLLAFVASAIAATSILSEMSLRRMTWGYRVGMPMLSAFIAFLFTLFSYGLMSLIVRLFTPASVSMLLDDPSFASFRFKFLQWAFAGVASGVAPFLVRVVLWRKWLIGFDHFVAGLASGAVGGAVWHIFSYLGVQAPGGAENQWLIAPDMYHAAVLGFFTWGAMHGLLAWGVPEELYAGWFRVLKGPRGGHRIPIDRLNAAPVERFVGHFPRGLDLHAPAESGVAELHVSFVTDGNGHYAVRGLSQAPTKVSRMLERVDLHYDARKPAPLETELSSEDTLALGPNGETVLEFIKLPKEET